MLANTLRIARYPRFDPIALVLVNAFWRDIMSTLYFFGVHVGSQICRVTFPSRLIFLEKDARYVERQGSRGISARKYKIHNRVDSSSFVGCPDTENS